MFVKTEIGKRGDVIRAERNKRDGNEPNIAVAHLIADNAGTTRPTEFETDRRKFLGRGRSLANAAADQGATLSGTDEPTLDPVLSLRRTVRVPRRQGQCDFLTIAAPSRNEGPGGRSLPPADSITNSSRPGHARRCRCATSASPQQASAFQHLGRHLVYPDMYLRADTVAVQAGTQSQSSLWPLAISGDFLDLHAAHQRRYGPRHRQGGAVGTGIPARAASPPIW